MAFMNRRSAKLVSLLSYGAIMIRRVATSILAGLLIAPSAFAATYKLDPDHTEVGFKIRHLAISNVSGRFVDVTGTFSYDPANVKASTTKAEIKVASITTNQGKRDTHLKSSEFFDIEKFPVMTFESKSVEPTGKDTFKVTGDLTMHGVTKPVTLDVTYMGNVKDPWGNDRAGFSATGTLNRKDFGLTYNKVLEAGGLAVGEEVTINLAVEGTKQG